MCRDVLEGKGPQRRPQKRLGRRLEEVAKAVGGGLCRLSMPWKPALGVRGTVAGHRLGALEPPPPPPQPSNASLGTWAQPSGEATACITCKSHVHASCVAIPVHVLHAAVAVHLACMPLLPRAHVLHMPLLLGTHCTCSHCHIGPVCPRLLIARRLQRGFLHRSDRANWTRARKPLSGVESHRRQECANTISGEPQALCMGPSGTSKCNAFGSSKPDWFSRVASG